MKASLKVEVCIDSVESAVAAQQGGADRVELCDNLLEGGTTPSAGMIAVVREEVHMGLHVMIRPRGGDFCYSEAEFNVMLRDLESVVGLGVDGAVFGVLRDDGRIDAARTHRLVDRARPMSVTFHRAFDMTRDPFEALETLIDLGIERVLTSGQEATALEGLPLIASLIERSAERIVVMPGGGITERNLPRILEASRPREVHVSADRRLEGAMDYRNERCYMGGALRPPEFSRSVADENRIAQFVRIASAS